MALVLAFTHLYIIFNLRLDQNGQWYQHLLTLFAIFYECNTEGTNFQILFYVCKMCIAFNFCKIGCEKNTRGDPVRIVVQRDFTVFVSIYLTLPMALVCLLYPGLTISLFS
jgi:hypothetical protein